MGGDTYPEKPAATISIQFPPFYEEDIEQWFIQLDTYFKLLWIAHRQDLMYDYFIIHANARVLSVIGDIMKNPPPQHRYDAIKERLFEVFGNE